MRDVWDDLYDDADVAESMRQWSARKMSTIQGERTTPREDGNDQEDNRRPGI